MNNNRLSTSAKRSIKIDRNLLLSEIANLVEGPSRSNYVIKEGRTFIKSLGKYRADTRPIVVQILEVSRYAGNLLHSFDSIAKLAKFLNVSYPTVIGYLQALVLA